MAPTRRRSSLSQLFTRQASATACSAAPIANCANRSKRRTSFFSMYSAGSNAFTSQATFTGPRAEVLHETRVGRELVALHAQLFDDDVLDLLFELLHFHCHG